MIMSTSCSSAGTTYYISSSSGNDSNSGTSKGSAWKSFEKINSLVLQPGDKVLLKRGDVWNERLEIYGGGDEKNPVTVSSYGDKKSPKPIIKLNNTINDICLLISDINVFGGGDSEFGKLNANTNIIVEELDLRNAYLGIYVREEMSAENKGLIIRNCDIAEIWCDEILRQLATANGGSVDKMNELGDLPKGDLPKVNKNSMKVEPTGGGAGEWLLATAIRFSGHSSKIFSDVEIYNVVMDNAVVGIEGIRMDNVNIHDVINTGSYGGIVRFSANCKNITVNRARLMGGSENYTFFGGTCGSFLGDVDNVTVSNCEFAYEYNLGENDGCGFDFEYACNHINFIDNVLHHNDSGGILFMQLPDPQAHDSITLSRNLFYGNMRRTKNAGYNFDVILYNKNGKDNIFLTDNFFFSPERANGGKTKFYGNLGEQGNLGGTVISGNTTKYLTEYRTRFSFNKDGNGEGFVAHTGSFNVSGGKAILTAEGKTAATLLTLPINGYCYNQAVVSVANDAKGVLYCQYKTSEGVTQSKEIKINGAGVYLLPLSSEQIAGNMTDILLIYKPSSSGGSIEMDFLQFIPDINATAVKSGNNTIDVTFGGYCFPMLAISPDKKDISLDGYTVTALEKVNYNTVRLTVAESVASLKGQRITVNGDLFIAYFADIINGLDCDRTAADDAALLGASAQQYFYGGTATFISK